MKIVRCDFLASLMSAVSEWVRVGEWMRGDWEDGAVERDGSQWVSPKALTPGGFDAIFPRREPTWEELVNNICPSSGRLTPTPNPCTSPHTRSSAVNLSTSHESHCSGQACQSWTGHTGPLAAQLKGPPGDPSHSKINTVGLCPRCSP